MVVMVVVTALVQVAPLRGMGVFIVVLLRLVRRVVVRVYNSPRPRVLPL